MAIRKINGHLIYRQDWDSLTRDIFFWLLTVGADSLGMQEERILALVEALNSPLQKWGRKAIIARLSLLQTGTGAPLISYPLGKGQKRRFLIFRQWQDFQKISFIVTTPTCPFPPEETLCLLSPLTCELLVRSYQVPYEALCESTHKLLKTALILIANAKHNYGGRDGTSPRQGDGRESPRRNNPAPPSAHGKSGRVEL